MLCFAEMMGRDAVSASMELLVPWRQDYWDLRPNVALENHKQANITEGMRRRTEAGRTEKGKKRQKEMERG